MKKENKEPSKQQKAPAEDTEPETVRGSGFTYDEAKHHTDKSIPADQVKDGDIVDLPELGKPNRP